LFSRLVEFGSEGWLVRLAPNILYWGDESGQANSTFVQIIFEQSKAL